MDGFDRLHLFEITIIIFNTMPFLQSQSIFIAQFCAHLYRKIVFIMDFFHITHLCKKLRSFISTVQFI